MKQRNKKTHVKRAHSYYTESQIQRTAELSDQTGIKVPKLRRMAMEYFFEYGLEKYVPVENLEPKLKQTSSFTKSQLERSVKIGKEKTVGKNIVSASQVRRDALDFYLTAVDEGKVVPVYYPETEEFLENKEDEEREEYK